MICSSSSYVLPFPFKYQVIPFLLPFTIIGHLCSIANAIICSSVRFLKPRGSISFLAYKSTCSMRFIELQCDTEEIIVDILLRCCAASFSYNTQLSGVIRFNFFRHLLALKPDEKIFGFLILSFVFCLLSFLFYHVMVLRLKLLSEPRLYLCSSLIPNSALRRWRMWTTSFFFALSQ